MGWGKGFGTKISKKDHSFLAVSCNEPMRSTRLPARQLTLQNGYLFPLFLSLYSRFSGGYQRQQNSGWFKIQKISSSSPFALRIFEVKIFDFPTQLVGDSANHRLNESGSFLLNIQQPTLRLNKSGGRFSIKNICATSKSKSERLKWLC